MVLSSLCNIKNYINDTSFKWNYVKDVYFRWDQATKLKLSKCFRCSAANGGGISQKIFIFHLACLIRIRTYIV